MPSTITSTDFKTFTPNTLIKSAEVNSNFDSFRGNLIPVEEATSSSSDLSLTLGDSTHRWARSFHHYGVTNLSASFTIDATYCDATVIINAAVSTVTATLPTAASYPGMRVELKAKDITNDILVNSNGGNIDGTSGSYPLTYDYRSLAFTSDGSQWWVVG